MLDTNKIKGLTSDLIIEIINEQKKAGKLGTEIVIRVDKILSQPRNRYLYICQLIKPGEYIDEMMNPLTNELWTVGFFEKDIYKLGDVLVGRYTIQKNEKNLDQLIRPVPSTLVKLEQPSQLVDKHGEEFVQFLQEKFGGEEELIGLMYERFLETAEKDIFEQEELKKKVLSEIDQLNTKINEKNKKFNKLTEDIKLKERDMEKIQLQFQKIREMFGLEEMKVNDNQEAVHYLKEDEDFFKIVQRGLYHINGENLVYEYDIIKRFITALRTDQLVLLTGPSGTGKSSLVYNLGEVLSPCKVHHIAVQSNWTDVQDLLGFFNPLKNIYMPTPFLQALVDARNDSNSLHIICLDEMNLAHVEYYFSSLLSAREKLPEKRFLDLYAYKFYREAILDLEEIVGKSFAEISSSDIETLEMIKRKEAREKYSKPIVEEFFYWIDQSPFHSKNLLAKAAEYTLNRKEGLKWIEIDNNPAENAIRPNVVNRKNWLFSISEVGAKANAICLSLAETAKTNGIDLYKYLVKLLTDHKIYRLISNLNHIFERLCNV